MNFPFQQGIDAAPVFPKDRKKSLAAVVFVLLLQELDKFFLILKMWSKSKKGLD